MKEFTLDCREHKCPVPLLMTEKEMRKMEVGDVITVTVGSSCALKVVPDWAREQNYNVDIEELDTELWDIIIEKTN